MRVGLLGAGTVAGGVCEILRLQGAKLAQQGLDFQIVKICLRDVSKKRDFEIPAGCEVVTDPKAVVDDPSIDLVIELMGGVTVAKDAVLGALANGKHVVTGNKALIASHLPVIQSAIKANPKLSFAYEAAVCGGIPIIQVMKHAYVGDEIISVSGIMNGTTNFILSKMEVDGAAYADVLAEAQRLGYAETPPDFDVKGWDARSKLAILCKLAFGVFVPEENIPCKGIEHITAMDFSYAERLRTTVKILGVASKNQDGSVSAYVSVCLVPLTSPLARTSGVMNSIAVKSRNLGTCFYSGPGAGRFPTANSVVNDMVMIAQGGSGDPFPRNAEVSVVSDIVAKFYVRFVIKDAVGIIKALGEFAAAQQISIDSILQLPIVDPNNVPFVMTTDRTTLSAVTKMAATFASQAFNLEEPLVMPIME